MTAAPTIEELQALSDEAARASRRQEKAAREAAQAHVRLRDAMREFAAAHPRVAVKEVRGV